MGVSIVSPNTEVMQHSTILLRCSLALALILLVTSCKKDDPTFIGENTKEFFENLPTWEESHRRVLTEGKLSKVKHPSPLHSAGKTAPEMMMGGFVPPMPPA